MSSAAKRVLTKLCEAQLSKYAVTFLPSATKHRLAMEPKARTVPKFLSRGAGRRGDHSQLSCLFSLEATALKRPALFERGGFCLSECWAELSPRAKMLSLPGHFS